MGPARHEMRAVDLVDDDEVDVADVPRGTGRPGADRSGDGSGDGPDPSGTAPGRGRGRPGPRLERRWGVAAVLVAALAVGGGTAVLQHRESERLAAVGRLPGALDPVDAPLTEVWRSDHRLWSPLTLVDGVIVGVSDLWDGTRDVVVVGLDRATGRERWATSVVRGATSPVGGVRCVVPEAAPGESQADRVVVCLSIDELGPSPRDMSELQPRRSRLLVLSVGSGEVLDEREVDPSTSVAALGPDLAVRSVTADGRVRVTRTDPRGREERWRFSGPAAELPAEFAFVRTDGDLVVVPGEEGWVLAADGTVVHTWRTQRPAAADWADVIRGRVLVQPLRDVLGTTRLVDMRTGRELETEGFPVTPTVDDGSTGELVLVQSAAGEGLLAQDVTSGRTRWSVRGADEGGLVVLEGRVVRAGGDELRAVDAVTGATRWVTPVALTRQFGLHTDGRLLIRTERHPELGTVLVGRGLDDGRVRWTSDVDDDLQHLVELEGQLLGVTEDAIIAFGDGSGAGDGGARADVAGS